MADIIYNSPDLLRVGHGLPVRVNCSIGVPNQEALAQEISKIKAISANSPAPDLMMDLSTSLTEPEPWEIIRENFGGPVGILPHYTIYCESTGISSSQLMRRIEQVICQGVNFITIHPTPTRDLFEKARLSRAIPITSRGGNMILRDILINKRQRNIYAELFDDICALAFDTGAVLNLGTAFRASAVVDGLDDIVRDELAIQSEFLSRARQAGVRVVLEGPGHVPLSQLETYTRSIRSLDVISMPLGPIVTDCFDKADHISSAIGAAYLMKLTRGGIINAITSVEHRGGIPNLKQLQEGLLAAHVAAQAATLSYNNEAFANEEVICRTRGQIQSCVITASAPGCARCQPFCPLIESKY